MGYLLGCCYCHRVVTGCRRKTKILPCRDGGTGPSTEHKKAAHTSDFLHEGSKETYLSGDIVCKFHPASDQSLATPPQDVMIIRHQGKSPAGQAPSTETSITHTERQFNYEVLLQALLQRFHMTADKALSGSWKLRQTQDLDQVGPTPPPGLF